MPLPSLAQLRASAFAWLQRQLGPGGVNLRLVWPDNWYQTGRDPPGSPRYGSLTFPAVYSSIDIISSDIARLPMRHWKDDGERRQEVRDSWPCRTLDKPNEYQTGFDLMKQLIASQLYRGNGYLFPIRNRRNQIDELHCLFPDYVWIYRTGTTEYFYNVSAQPLADIESAVMVPPRDMFHHRMLTINDPLWGITPMVAAAISSSAGLAILRSSEKFFNRMARPSGVLSTDKSLARQKAEEMKERWQRIYAGEEGAGDVAVLEEGLQWKPLTMTAVDAQLIDQLRYSVEDVARVYRVPLFMLGDLTKVNYNSSEQLTRIYWAGCLSAHMQSLEWRISQFFGMDGRTEYLEFDLDALFKAEEQARIETLSRSVQGGLRSNNEARRVLGLNPVAGGDTVFMQQQMVPVAQLAGRSDLNPKPPQMPSTAPDPRDAPGGRELALSSPLSTANDIHSTAPDLTEALMRAVFNSAPAPVVPRSRYTDSVLASRHQQRRLAYGPNGRVERTYH